MGEENPEFTPPWMEKVAEAGGWEEHAKLLEKIGKIPEEKWRNLSKMVEGIERVFDKGGTDLDVISSLKDDLEETIRTELAAALSPLKNELAATINAILGPFMPIIQETVTGIATLIQRGMGAIQALIDGRFEEWFKQQLDLAQQKGGWAAQLRQRYSEAYWSGPVGRKRINEILAKQGLSLEELEASALAGGIYSGQFDLSTSAEDLAAQVRKYLEDLNLDFDLG